MFCIGHWSIKHLPVVECLILLHWCLFGCFDTYDDDNQENWGCVYYTQIDWLIEFFNF